MVKEFLELQNKIHERLWEIIELIRPYDERRSFPSQRDSFAPYSMEIDENSIEFTWYGRHNETCCSVPTKYLEMSDADILAAETKKYNDLQEIKRLQEEERKLQTESYELSILERLKRKYESKNSELS